MSESKEEELVEFQGKRMYPEVAAYFEAARLADKARDDVHAEASYVWEKVVREARFNYAPTEDQPNFDSYALRRRGQALYEPYQVYAAAMAASDLAFNEATSNRREGLRTSIHPEVKWIEANALRGEQAYSEAVLKALPVADPAELWEIKRRHGMCAEFDRLYAAAELDGVFTGGKRALGARQRAALNNWADRNWGSNYARQLMQQLSPLMKEIEAERVKELEDAKAEWQGLDEAWRSERSRRGAATRAANAVAQAREDLAAAEDGAETRETVSTDVSDAEREALGQAYSADRAVRTTADVIAMDTRSVFADDPFEQKVDA